jgi:hypothetical protein
MRGDGQISFRVDCVGKGVRNERWRKYQMIDCVYLILFILLILSRNSDSFILSRDSSHDSDLLIPSRDPEKPGGRGEDQDGSRQ